MCALCVCVCVCVCWKVCWALELQIHPLFAPLGPFHGATNLENLRNCTDRQLDGNLFPVGRQPLHGAEAAANHPVKGAAPL